MLPCSRPRLQSNGLYIFFGNEIKLLVVKRSPCRNNFRQNGKRVKRPQSPLLISPLATVTFQRKRQLAL